MTVARTLTDAELETLLERAAERGAARALAHRDTKPAIRRRERVTRVASSEAHEAIARMNVRKGIRRDR